MIFVLNILPSKHLIKAHDNMSIMQLQITVLYQHIHTHCKSRQSMRKTKNIYHTDYITNSQLTFERAPLL